jgi:4-hydroxy-tetrahydrodipicolinate synthase
VADDRLRVYLYHIPQMTQVGFSLKLIERLRKDFPQVVVGIKDSSGDWANTRTMIEALPGFQVFTSADTSLLDSLRLGGAGCISAIANLNARMLRAIFDAPAAADAIQATASALRREIQAKPLISATKSLLAHYRRDPTWRNTRAPLEPFAAGEASALAAKLASLSFNLEFPPEA